jgi:hypothetical protein
VSVGVGVGVSVAVGEGVSVGTGVAVGVLVGVGVEEGVNVAVGVAVAVKVALGVRVGVALTRASRSGEKSDSKRARMPQPKTIAARTIRRAFMSLPWVPQHLLVEERCYAGQCLALQELQTRTAAGGNMTHLVSQPGAFHRGRRIPPADNGRRVWQCS